MGLRFHRKCDEKGDLLGKGRVVHWEPTSLGGFWVLLLSLQIVAVMKPFIH